MTLEDANAMLATAAMIDAGEIEDVEVMPGA